MYTKFSLMQYLTQCDFSRQWGHYWCWDLRLLTYMPATPSLSLPPNPCASP